mmetsp:Transcript_98587/g.181246  ORF Transcript_98587/g.181246 Transcript_98587/m.181246 type:complete len:865 (+) Transcript_98587:86-2680(+)
MQGSSHLLLLVASSYFVAHSSPLQRRSQLWAGIHQPSPSSEDALIYAGSAGLTGQLSPNSTVELMRFVTAYGKGLEAAVDITPYSQLLRAGAKSGNLTWYSFIDTYVSRTKSSEVDHILYQNNITGKCVVFNSTQGNGWLLSAYLIFWPRKTPDFVSTQPREHIMLSSGYYGGVLRIGKVAMIEGEITDGGNSVLLNKRIDVDPNTNLVEVWGCDDADSAHKASYFGYLARQVELFTRHGNPEGAKMVTDDAFQTMLWEQVSKIEVAAVDHATLTVNGTYNTSFVTLEPGMPVFYDSSSLFTDVNFSGTWVNTSLPLHRIGNVTFIDGDGNVTIVMQKPCLPSSKLEGLPSLLVPNKPDTVNRTLALVDAAKTWGMAVANQSLESNSSVAGETRLRSTSAGSQMYFLKPQIAPVDPEQTLDLEQPEHSNGSVFLDSLPLLGKIDISATPEVVNGTRDRMPLLNSASLITNRSDGQKVCAVAQKQHGHLFTKKFNLSTLESTDKVVYQLTVTGHGWSATTEQCGEFCHAVYRLKLNGNSAANVSQFRTDCKKNPIKKQRGTWEESRNGWCPGSVEPGLFMDLTKHSRKGENFLSVDVLVWSNATLSYEPYTDYGGFVFGDKAWLTVGLSAFIYDQSAVKAIQKQPKAYTAAEAAIRNGSSHPSSLTPPAFVIEPLSLLESGSKSERGRGTPSAQRRTKRAFLLNRKRQKPSKASFLGGHLHANGSKLLGKKLIRSELKAHVHTDLAAVQIGGVASARRVLDVHSESELNGTLQDELDRYDFEGTSPWYLYNSTEEDPLQAAGTTRVTLYNGLLVDISNRESTVSITRDALPNDWSHVALHFQLSKPPNLDYDHWDREGSFGLRLR